MFIYVDIFLLLLVYQYYQRHVYTRNTMFASFSLLANTVDALCVCFFLIACLCTYLFTSVCYFVESEEVILTNPEDTGKMSELVPLSRTNTGSLVWYTQVPLSGSNKSSFPCLVIYYSALPTIPMFYLPRVCYPTKCTTHVIARLVW